jgi:hypothetical protein
VKGYSLRDKNFLLKKEKIIKLFKKAIKVFSPKNFNKYSNENFIS